MDALAEIKLAEIKQEEKLMKEISNELERQKKKENEKEVKS